MTRAPVVSPVLQTGAVPGTPQLMLAHLLVYALLSAATAGVVALAYRWYFRDRIPDGAAALVGVGAVAAVVNGIKLGQFADPTSGVGALLELDAVLFNVAVVAAALAAAPVGLRAGDAAAANLFSVSAVRELEGDLGTVLRSVGRVVAVELPEEIRDMETHDPVPESTKAELAGKTLVFPRRLTTAELRDRLATRIKEDHGVGYVDVELDESREVTYLAVGSRLLGVGPTLAPGTAAVAIRADPPADASPGDAVQVWTAGPDPERLLAAELRGVAADVVTLAVDEADASELGADERYRLVTLPTESGADREFASLLRAADETMAAVRLAAGSALAGGTLRAVDATVAAVKPADGPVVALPPQSRPLAAGDTLYVVARPEAIRRLEAEAAGGDEGEGGGAEPDGGDDADFIDPDGADPDEAQPSTPGTEE